MFLNIREDTCVERIVKRGQNRADDSEEVARERVDLFYRETYPVLAEYERRGVRIVEVDGEKEKNVVFDEVKRRIEEVILN